MCGSPYTPSRDTRVDSMIFRILENLSGGLSAPIRMFHVRLGRLKHPVNSKLIDQVPVGSNSSRVLPPGCAVRSPSHFACRGEQISSTESNLVSVSSSLVRSLVFMSFSSTPAMPADV